MYNIFVQPMFHERNEKKLILEIKRMKGVEGKVPRQVVGEDFVEFRGIRYNMKYGGVSGNTGETMILVSVGDELPARVVVQRRLRNAEMAERAVSRYGRLPNIIPGLYSEIAADVMARVSIVLQNKGSDLVSLYLDSYSWKSAIKGILP